MKDNNHTIKNYNWNQDETNKVKDRLILADETLRDGLQSGTIKQKPNIDEMQRFLHYINDLGIDEVNIGFPASSNTANHLAKYISNNIPKLRPYCTGRATIDDVKHILELRNNTGANVFASLFIGTSPIRTRIENWNFDDLVKQVRKAVKLATENNLEVMLVTEDTTRTPPKLIDKIYGTAISEGATRICVADTTGEITPKGVSNLISYIRNEIIKTKTIQIEWHGHNDRGLATSNAIQAVLSGVDRISITALGIGERAGNVPTHEFIYNLYLLGLLGRTNVNLKKVIEYSKYAAKMCGIEISKSEPILGEGIFITESGVHAAAILKSNNPKDKNNVYSSVDASLLGREQQIVVGPNSGKSNVLYVLAENGIPTDNISEEKIKSILLYAKRENRQLTLEEIKKQL